MSEEIDRIYELIERAKADCTRQRNLAVYEWNADKAERWQSCLNALTTAAECIRPMISERVPQPCEPSTESAIDTTDRLEHLAETENLALECTTDDTDAAEYLVLVPRKPLVDALRRMTRFRKKSARKELMSMSFRNGLLTFAMLNVSEGVPAEGVWANDIMANCAILYGIAKVPPIEDPVVIKVEQGQLHIGSAVTPVHLG